jgi:hypothetical protein
LVIKEIALKRRKDASKHTGVHKKDTKKEKEKEKKEEHPKKPKRHRKCYITPPASCL